MSDALSGKAFNVAIDTKAIEPTTADGPDVTIALDPIRPGVERARLIEYGIPVWALIGDMSRVEGEIDDGEIARVASDYLIPNGAVRAAVAYYREHRQAIDAFLDSNYIVGG